MPEKNARTRAKDWCSSSEARSFGLITLVLVVVALLSEPTATFWFDSGVYWELDKEFMRDGQWSLLNLDNGLRGYVPALMFGAVRGLSEAVGIPAGTAIKLFNAPLFALIGTVLLPRLGNVVWPNVSVGFVGRVLLAAMLIAFWGGFINYPLTDFPALAAGIGAVLLIAKRRSLPAAFLAGVLAAAAVNLRPAYLVLALGLLVLAAWREGSSPWPRRALTVAVTLLGLVAVSLPQSLIAQRNHEIWSPIPAAAADLDTIQLTAGLWVQLYGAHLDPRADGPQLTYIDPAGKKILETEDRGEPRLVEGAGDFLELAWKHPVAMTGVVLRHTVNGLDQRYASPYPKRLDTGQRRIWRLAGFALLYVALARLLWPAARRQLGPMRWRYLAALALACATSLPSAMEQRFMLPVFVIALLIVVLPGWPAIRAVDGSWRRRYTPAIALSVGAVAFIGVCWWVASAATSNLDFGPLG